jgi:hypothetical protein
MGIIALGRKNLGAVEDFGAYFSNGIQRAFANIFPIPIINGEDKFRVQRGLAVFKPVVLIFSSCGPSNR